ncbi:FAD-dependent oxidoreductase [Ascidiimonas aurantiaca]|uniref:FAD-dependent oxidoreductase n=1 Tax=Ascidiimonas aurantiaca TaxID=1685432 RepID=UPI0030EC0E75
MSSDTISSVVSVDIMSRFLKLLEKELSDPHKQIKTGTGDWEAQVSYTEFCQIFNRRIQARPWVIVYCRTERDVQNTYRLAISFNFEVRIRAGGHDHEGECTGTNTILIDVSQMDWVHVDPKTKIASIGPGNIFRKLTTELANEDVMLPHGTCATVGIAGFTMGGGWGPWTRKKGMCCEWLVGANIVLGNGERISVDVQGNKVPDLLWALKGGGGMSYGLVTEFRIQTFELPEELIRFQLTWNPYPKGIGDQPKAVYPTIKVLKAWENVINSPDTPKLIGTNLMINALPASLAETNVDSISQNCVMYGYWEGNEKSLKTFINNWFADVPQYDLEIDPHHGGTGTDTKEAFGDYLMSNWARESHNKILENRHRMGENVKLPPRFLNLLAEGKPLPPDYDDPAPHKITSRLVEKQGLGESGHRALIRSLISDLLFEGNRDLGLFTYVTLGAITGNYYRENPNGTNSAFPYKDKLYTIQYQTWWNETTAQKEELQDNYVYVRTNRALDWMQVARDFDIPNTSGSFISFKDSSIPTKTYFAESYKDLIKIKEKYSKDPYNHLRIRKSII